MHPLPHEERLANECFEYTHPKARNVAFYKTMGFRLTIYREHLYLLLPYESMRDSFARNRL